MPRPKKEQPTGFGRKLKAIRERAGLTQDELAERTGLNKFSIAKLEQEHREPNWPTVLSLARALGVSCEAFTEEPLTAETPAPGESPPAPAPPKRKAAGGKKPGGSKGKGK
jgi:DNA-binding XRE family transcriptional regulator